MDSSPGNITRLLQAARSGDQGAEAAIMTIVYPELRRLAGACLRGERPDHTLQATALVNELYLRLAGQTHRFENGAHLRAIAVHGMHNILVDHARARQAGKRGGDPRKLEFDDLDLASPAVDDTVLALEEALSRLSQWDPRQARVVELRFYGGMTEGEIGDVLGMSERTVKRDWRQARAWLYKELGH